MEERIQKLISDAGGASRRKAEELIREGRVTCNGVTAKLGEKADRDTDVICVDGVPLSFAQEKVYLMLNKPRGYVTTLRDEKDRHCVEELVRNAGRRVYPVGRLDMYSEGLLILTDDGELAQRLMHPSHEVNKTYRVTVSGDRLAERFGKLVQPMEIDGYRIRPAQLHVVSRDGDNAVLDLTIHEGRNRQVRKMCDQCGLRVRKLQRIAEGGLRLGTLAPGSWRYLTQGEVKLLLRGDPDGERTV